jgi:hypothetical protein
MHLNLLPYFQISSVISLLPVTVPMPVSQHAFTLQQALIHHLATGACVDHISDVNLSSRLHRSTSCAVAHNLDSAAFKSAAVLDIILAAEQNLH